MEDAAALSGSSKRDPQLALGKTVQVGQSSTDVEARLRLLLAFLFLAKDSTSGDNT
jgi:hypothetical protein